jgi:DtxR family Mn-dependent transcriptional regulator
MLTPTEENYLKAIFKIAETEKKTVSTNAIAKHLGTTAASVTDMIKKLSEKSLIHYEKYKGVSLTNTGNKAATHLIRKHRLWEVFLVNKLRFAWHQVHDIAEELEHIDSDELISRLDAFLDYPKFDPHGDPIPNADGRFTLRNQISLSEMPIHQTGIVLGVKESDTDFLKHLTKINIKLGSEISIVSRTDFDQSMRITIDTKYEEVISKKVSQYILMKKK